MYIAQHTRKYTIPAHLIFFIGLYFFNWSEDAKYLWWIFLLWSLFSGFGIAIGYHRLLSHKAFETKTWVKRLLALLGCFAGQGTPIFWSAMHRSLHHPYSDKEKDPHSPVHGFWHSYMGWQFKFKEEQVPFWRAADLLEDKFLLFLSNYYYPLNWLVWVVISLISWKFFLFAFLPASLLASHQENIINSICHTPGIGYRNFATNDNSTNIWFLGILFWGHGYHNNHHHDPKAWNYAKTFWEFDPSSVFIRLLRSNSGSSEHTVNNAIKPANRTS